MRVLFASRIEWDREEFGVCLEEKGRKGCTEEGACTLVVARDRVGRAEECIKNRNPIGLGGVIAWELMA